MEISRFRGLTDCRSAAMLIKSALRDLLSVSYGIVSILLTGSLRSPPPIRLRREMELDLLNGFTGKTVIHPNQIPVVNEMLRVSQQDYADARAILNWDTGSGSLVSASEDGGRMNEYNTHSRWARRIVLRAERYGVRA